MARSGSVDALNEVQDVLDLINKTQEYKPMKIKAMLEHLRSSLDYLAHDVYSQCCTQPHKQPPNIYFPYGKQMFVDNFFTRTLGIKDPNTSPFYEIFNSIQHYRTGENWLVMMCNLTNEVKHRNPLPLNEEETVTGALIQTMGMNFIQVDNTSTVTVKDFSVRGKKLSDFTYDKGKFEVTKEAEPVNISFTTEKKIKFHGDDYEVSPFIQKCITEIRKLINRAYDELEKKP